jgi:pectate lyase
MMAGLLLPRYFIHRSICGLLVLSAFGVGLHADLINLSSRSLTEAGEGAVIAGFVVEGGEGEPVLVRAAGPALDDFGVEGALRAVRLELFSGEVSLAENTGWDTGPNGGEIVATAERVGAFAFAPGSLDAALLVDLPPGAYTAIVTPASEAETSGVTLVEVYDADPSNQVRLVNLSARSKVRGGADKLIAGFVVNGEGNRVLTRAIGPTLGEYGVVGFLSDPAIEIFRGETSRATADNWWTHVDAYEIASRSAGVGAFPLPPENADAASIIRPSSEAHSVHVTDVTEGEGIALAEVYDLRALTSLPSPEVFDLVGFARLTPAGGAQISGGGARGADYNPATGEGQYWRIEAATVADPEFGARFRTALVSDQPLVIEINTTIDLSVHGLPDPAENATAIAHPELIPEGQEFGRIGFVEVGSHKTLFSATGNGVIKRGTLRLLGSTNVIIRNLQFRELWEWDDATRNGYDRNAWDYITLLSRTADGAVVERTRQIWIDHCDFANAYDGQLDVVLGSDLVTVSWCRFGGGFADGSSDWVETQMTYLEENRSDFEYYDFLRLIYSPAEILARARAHKKSSLVGNGNTDENQAQDRGYLNVTYHHNWYHGVDDRMPRARLGNAHVFNIWSDDSPTKGVAGLQRLGVKATAGGAMKVENASFIDVDRPVQNRLIPEPVGRVSVTGSVNLDRATGEDRGFDDRVLEDPADFRWNAVAAETGLGDWPDSANSSLPEGYFPAGRSAADYIHPVDYLRTRLDEAGVVVPGNAADEERLRGWLLSITPSAGTGR